MSVTDKDKQYVKKYQQEKTDTVTVRPAKGTKDRWRAAAAASGKSMQRFVIDAVDQAAAAVPEKNTEDPSRG